MIQKGGNACRVIIYTQYYSVVHNVTFKESNSHIVSTIEKKKKIQFGKYYKVSIQKSKMHDVISSETIVPIPEILHVTFPFQVILGSGFKIKPPTTSLVTTACKLMTPSIKRNKSRDQRDTIKYSRAKVLQKCINPPADLKSV